MILFRRFTHHRPGLKKARTEPRKLQLVSRSSLGQQMRPNWDARCISVNFGDDKISYLNQVLGYNTGWDWMADCPELLGGWCGNVLPTVKPAGKPSQHISKGMRPIKTTTTWAELSRCWFMAMKGGPSQGQTTWSYLWGTLGVLKTNLASSALAQRTRGFCWVPKAAQERTRDTDADRARSPGFVFTREWSSVAIERLWTSPHEAKESSVVGLMRRSSRWKEVRQKTNTHDASERQFLSLGMTQESLLINEQQHLQMITPTMVSVSSLSILLTSWSNECEYGSVWIFQTCSQFGLGCEWRPFRVNH